MVTVASVTMNRALKTICLAGLLGFAATASVSAGTLDGVTLPIVERPPKTATVPDDVKSATEQFKAARESYLANHKDLTSKLKDASKEQQEAIREELRVQRDQFKAAAKELSKQAKEAKEKLDPNLGRKVDGETGSHGNRGR